MNKIPDEVYVAAEKLHRLLYKHYLLNDTVVFGLGTLEAHSPRDLLAKSISALEDRAGSGLATKFAGRFCRNHNEQRE